jgi:formylglycine-generating enzyme required for sulfatase activity
MGDNRKEGNPDELPVHTVYLDSYKISQYEVTFDKYDSFCEATGRSKPGDSGWGRGTRPVIHVSWNDARAFCDWLSQKTGKNIHLPTEAQWEKAARGTDQRRYPWGNGDPSCSRANYESCREKTMPVGSYPSGVSPYGIHDMAGNVWEWCSDRYSSSYYSSSPRNNPTGSASGSFRVQRGGSWYVNAGYIRSANRRYNTPPSRGYFLGFRLAQD